MKRASIDSRTGLDGNGAEEAAKPASSALRDGTLWLGTQPALQMVPEKWTLVPDETTTGVFLKGKTTEPASFVEIPLGRIAALRRFTSGVRVRPFWMTPIVGQVESHVKAETQWLLAETTSNGYALIIPLIDTVCRFSLWGADDGLMVVGETGDPAVVVQGGIAVFVAVGHDPYSLLAAGARAVQIHLRSGGLRAEKPVPDFIDLFGWCTWDAFYREVSPDKVREGLAAFAAGGVEPRLLILDDGWQTVTRRESGEERLTSLAPNARFGGDLTSLVRVAKDDFRVQRFLVWHALLGYWGGLCERALPDYETRTVPRSFGPGILSEDPHWNVRPWGAVVGVPSAERIGSFFDDYHRQLRMQGVDGVKVDNQAMLEAVSCGQGGRVALARVTRQALEDSVKNHFGGRMINCMSCTPECVYLAARSTVMRTSDDFWPLRPDLHGMHVYTNAHTGLWFGEFMQPDWDMFQSANAYGGFHAAARAVSGGAVYVSDHPGQHDFTLLRKLVLSDGTVLRADGPGRPTQDCLFADPTIEPILFKVFNTNRDCGIVGVFNARCQKADSPEQRLAGNVGPAEVWGLAGEDFAAYCSESGRLVRCNLDSRIDLSLAEGGWEIVSFAPIEGGFAALGLVDKFNSTAAIVRREWHGEGECRVELRDGGAFLGWSAQAPIAVLCDDAAIPFSYDDQNKALVVNVPPGGRRALTVRWLRSGDRPVAPSSSRRLNS